MMRINWDILFYWREKKDTQAFDLRKYLIFRFLNRVFKSKTGRMKKFDQKYKKSGEITFYQKCGTVRHFRSTRSFLSPLFL